MEYGEITSIGRVSLYCEGCGSFVINAGGAHDRLHARIAQLEEMVAQLMAAQAVLG